MNLGFLTDILKAAFAGHHTWYRVCSWFLLVAIPVWWIYGFKYSNEPRLQISISKFDMNYKKFDPIFDVDNFSVDWTLTVDNAQGTTIRKVYLYFTHGVGDAIRMQNGTCLLKAAETEIPLAAGEPLVQTLHFGNREEIRQILNGYLDIPVVGKLIVHCTTASSKPEPIILEISKGKFSPEYKGWLVNNIYETYSFKID